jgi:hypothetical protein
MRLNSNEECTLAIFASVFPKGGVMNMKCIAIVLVIVVISSGVVYAIPPIPPPPPTEPPETPEPEPAPGGEPPLDMPRKFSIFSTEPVLKGYAGSSIEYTLKVTQKGYPDLVVHLSADVPDTWESRFSHNDFTLSPEELIDVSFTLSPPETAAETYEITIHAVGKTKEGSLNVKDSVVVTAVTDSIDVGVATFAVNPSQPKIGESVTIAVTAANYTQQQSDVVVEFLVNNRVISEQDMVLPAGAFLPVTFGWTAQEGTFTFLVKISATGDTNHGNDSVSFTIVLKPEKESIDALYQQAKTWYTNGDYALAQNVFSTVAAQYTKAGEHDKALQASQLEERCTLYVRAQELMNQGERALQMELYEEAAQHFEEARDLYAHLGDAEKERIAQANLDEAGKAQKPWLIYIGICVGVVAAIIVKKFY